MKTTKVRQMRFIDSATSIILACGGKDASNKMRYKGTKYDLSTVAGSLVITIPEDQDIVFTVFMKFDEPPRATNVFKELGKSTSKLNPFSGKYNVHQFDEDSALNLLRQHLELLTNTAINAR